MSTPSIIKSYRCLQPLTGNRFVKFSAEKVVDFATGPGDAITGVTDKIVPLNAGDMTDVHLGGFGTIEAGGVFAFGDMLTADATGRGVKAVVNGAVPVNVGARALGPATAAGDMVPVLVNVYRTPLGA